MAAVAEAAVIDKQVSPREMAEKDMREPVSAEAAAEAEGE